MQSPESGRPLDPYLFSLSAYRYDLPPELIAQEAREPRDESRLLVLHRSTGEIEHRRFRDFPKYFGKNDLLVANNTAVLKARLLGNRVLPDGTLGGKIEMLLLEKRSERTWEGAFHSSARQLRGLRFRVPAAEGFIEGELISGAKESPIGTVVAQFDRDPVEAGAGELPLPHYIEREKPGEVDERRYQTIYAKEKTSAAAPTAGLHFTHDVLNQLESQGTGWAEITLNVGLGTFRPVKVQDIREHKMHEEKFHLPQAVRDRIVTHRKAGGRITAIGTTSVRTLESAMQDGELKAGESRTSIFIHPGYRFQLVDRLLTNFHLPESTLLMLVSAFAGYENTMRTYDAAVKERYRFFSYGDAMLVLE